MTDLEPLGASPISSRSSMPKILVVDDDEGVRAGLTANLQLEGYDVSAASDGAEAIAMLTAQRYDLILSDVVMPNASGVEVLAAVRRLQLQTPFILISAYVSEELVTRALADGLFAMLYKPFSMERILHVVARALKHNVVLVVGHGAGEGSSLASALRSAGVGVAECADGPSAVNFAQANAVDVCVLDLGLRPSNGLSTCDELQQVNDRMDIIAVIDKTNKDARSMAHSGIVKSLVKPFGARELLTAIARVRGATPVRK